MTVHQKLMSNATRMLVVLSLALTGCDSANKSKAETNGVSGIPEAAQFAAMFPRADHFISYYTGTKGDPLWNSKAGVHGRYVIVMQFKIDFDPSRTKPTRTSPPRFFLREVSQITAKPDNKFNTSYSSNQIQFGIGEWERLRKAGGDLSVLGIDIVTDRPIADFDQAWHSG